MSGDELDEGTNDDRHQRLFVLSARLVANNDQIDAWFEEQFRLVAVEGLGFDDREPQSWETCACGAAADIVYVTTLGDVPWCFATCSAGSTAL